MPIAIAETFAETIKAMEIFSISKEVRVVVQGRPSAHLLCVE
jgi:hypothetical protein